VPVQLQGENFDVLGVVQLETLPNKQQPNYEAMIDILRAHDGGVWEIKNHDVSGQQGFA
jgi:hypothetical protein